MYVQKDAASIHCIEKKNNMDYQGGYPMKDRKRSMKRILTVFLVLAVFATLSVPAFAEKASPDSVESGSQVSEGNKDTEEKAEPAAPKGRKGLTDEEKAELQEIYDRLGEIKGEFEALYDTHSEEIAKLNERADELEEKAGYFDLRRWFRDFKDMITEEDWPDQLFGDQGILPFGELSGLWGSNPDEAGDAAVPENKPAEDENAANEAKKPYIGIYVVDLTEEVTMFTGVQSGVLVQAVDENTPAAKAGIQAYDIIIGVGDQKVDSTEELKAIVAESVPGDTLSFHLLRQGEAIERNVEVGGK